MSNFFKIECLDCGTNADLLTDVYHRIICRECLTKHEFKEVENEIYSESYREMESGHKILLQAANLTHGDDRCDGLREFIESNGEL